MKLIKVKGWGNTEIYINAENITHFGNYESKTVPDVKSYIEVINNSEGELLSVETPARIAYLINKEV